jgi:predicted O-methyltransferase YrrM
MTLHKIDLSNFDEFFEGRSSYREERFSKVLRTICILKNPKKIVEFGILDGYSLDCFLEATGEECEILAYDLFEEFPYNSAKFDSMEKKYNKTRASIGRENLFNAHNIFEDGSIDIMHIDIANDGDVYDYCINNLMPKISDSGVMILEGGSKERDDIEWMIKYNKPKIREVLYRYESEYIINVFNEFPSLTIITKK